MDTNKIFTVTIGIPAHNEEKNIASLLNSILRQKGEDYILEKIEIVCDGCTDNTEQIVLDFSKKYPKVKLIKDGKRLGQTVRLSEFYSNLTSDIFITFDGDVVLGNDTVIEELVRHFRNKKVVLVGGQTIPYPQKKFMGKMVEAHEFFWRFLTSTINNGNNIQSLAGPIIASRKDFIKSVSIPGNIVASDHFLYFSAVKNGYEYKLAKKAFVLMHVPTTISDFIKQHSRFQDSAEKLIDYFGSWAEKYYKISKSAKIKAYFNAFLHYPIYLPLSFGLVTLQRIFSHRYKVNDSNYWEVIKSSK